MSTAFYAELVIRIVLGCILGGVIGYERDLHGRPAGLRTHAIVGLASATFMVVSIAFAWFQPYTAGGIMEVDTSRIAASVVSGIGFLAGGAILRTGLNVQGLTTAAGLWLVAAIGLAAGGGMYLVALSSTGIGVVVLTVLRRFEDKTDHLVHRRLHLVVDNPQTSLTAVRGALLALNIGFHEEDYEHDLSTNACRFRALLSLPRSATADTIIGRLEPMPDVRSIRLEAVD